ncbi:hypothetical protein DCS_03037 [Drechmeria coniospora]|uniref:Signal peptidase complex subunit 1 n=1 Tax=Drechmeria coniospora TaxID=98403 RepID=A0A151GXX4_DRECN|nr:hypothetical protein DCS_03037 [Drechmeria coniospora]KYK61892.1 hypothetical protein DCS_03037 [Drechmeria coniospora]
MAEQILDTVRDVVEGQIVRPPDCNTSRRPLRGCPSTLLMQLADMRQDFHGQRRAENFATLLLALSGLLAFNIGYYYQDIRMAVFIGLGGTLLTFLLVTPPWPFYNKNPVKWLPAGSGWQ